MGRKTCDVAFIVEKANTQLRRTDVSDDFRNGIASLLGAILHETDNYSGFNYVDWHEGGYSRWVEDGQPKDVTPYLGNETRRVYYYNISKSSRE